ncbi:MAG: hypothetical protein ACYC9L_04420 [Sulfuricaulis sp.]
MADDVASRTGVWLLQIGEFFRLRYYCRLQVNQLQVLHGEVSRIESASIVLSMPAMSPILRHSGRLVRRLVPGNTQAHAGNSDALGAEVGQLLPGD